MLMLLENARCCGIWIIVARLLFCNGMESHDDEIEYRDKDCDVIDDNGKYIRDEQIFVVNLKKKEK